MRWRVGRNSIVGADNVDLPQFSLVKYDTLSTIQVLASGMLYFDLSNNSKNLAVYELKLYRLILLIWYTFVCCQFL